MSGRVSVTLFGVASVRRSALPLLFPPVKTNPRVLQGKLRADEKGSNRKKDPEIQKNGNEKPEATRRWREGGGLFFLTAVFSPHCPLIGWSLAPSQVSTTHTHTYTHYAGCFNMRRGSPQRVLRETWRVHLKKKKIPKLTFYLNFYEYHPCKSINTMTASPKFTASHSQTWYRSTRLILFVDPVEIGINSTACLFQYIELFVWV